MDKTEKLRNRLAKIVSDTLGKDSGQLFYDFYKDDDADSIVDGAKSLLLVMLGPEMTDKKIEGAKKDL